MGIHFLLFIFVKVHIFMIITFTFSMCNQTYTCSIHTHKCFIKNIHIHIEAILLCVHCVEMHFIYQAMYYTFWRHYISAKHCKSFHRVLSNINFAIPTMVVNQHCQMPLGHTTHSEYCHIYLWVHASERCNTHLYIHIYISIYLYKPPI